MNGQTAVVIGATGLVGSHLVSELISDPAFEKVILLTRRPYKGTAPKLVNTVVNFGEPGELSRAFDHADTLFCTIGTTQKQVKGDKAAYRNIDFEIPVNVAKIGLQKGVNQFILVSAVGAEANSSVFYLRLKGELEAAISSMGFTSVYILRPSILLGKRNGFRLGEAVGKAVMRSAAVLFFGPMRKYYPVKAKEAAHAMVNASKQAEPGVHILHYDDMMKLNGQS